MKKQEILPFHLQYFAAPPTNTEKDKKQKNSTQDNSAQETTVQNHGAQEPTTQKNSKQENAGENIPEDFDYEKLAEIISGKQSVAEADHLKQKNLSGEEMEQEVSGFKTEKAQKQPDIEGLQNQLIEIQQIAKQALIEKEAILEAISLGVEAKTIPYLIKLADLSEVMESESTVNREALKNALNKVLEDVPQLKPQKEENKGFQIGAKGNLEKNNTPTDTLKKTFGL